MTSLAVDQDSFSSQPEVPARILVVDDEDTIRLVLAKYLRTRGFEVCTAESGDAALEALAGVRFDLMLCDVRMPGLSGVEIVPAALESNPELGIVMLSAVNDAPTATQAMAQGVLDYLIKPIELTQLYDAAMRALHKRSLRNEQRQAERRVFEAVAFQTRVLEAESAALRRMLARVVDRHGAAMDPALRDEIVTLLHMNTAP